MFLSPARLRKDDITAIKEGIQEYVEQAAAASQGTPPSGDFDLSCHLRTRRSGRPDSQGRRYLGCKIAKFWLEIREGFGSNKLSQSGDTSEISDVTATRGGISYTTTFAWDHKRRNVADSVVSVWKQKPRSHEPEFLVAFGLRFERTWMCFYQVDAPTGQTDGKPLATIPTSFEMKSIQSSKGAASSAASFSQTRTRHAKEINYVSTFSYHVLSSVYNNAALVLGSSVILVGGFLFCSKRARRTAFQLFRSENSREQQITTAAASSEGNYGALENAEEVDEAI